MAYTPRLHQPDINGTHTPLDTALSSETQQLFQNWTAQGNFFAPNTSYTIAKIAKNIYTLANGPYICELGVGVYGKDAQTVLLYHPLSNQERSAIASVFAAQALSKIQTAAFFPKFERGDTHGMQVFLHPQTSTADHGRLLKRHHAIERLTADPNEFAAWIRQHSKDFGMLEWKPLASEHPSEFLALNYSYDSGGTFFITPRNINKATTFMEVIASHYQHIPTDRISIAGDSGPTDGPLFTIPGILHIAVGDKALLQPVSGQNLFAPTPDDANRYLRKLLDKSPEPVLA